MLESRITELKGKADDNSKFVLTKELAGLREKKRVSLTRDIFFPPTEFGRRKPAEQTTVSEVISVGSNAYDKQVKSGKVPAKNPEIRDLRGRTSQKSCQTRKIPMQSRRKSLIDKLQQQIHVIQAEMEKAAQSAGEATELKERIEEYEGRFKIVAANLNKLEEVPKAGKLNVQEWETFLSTAAAQDKLRLSKQIGHLRACNQMFVSIDAALIAFCSCVV
ncbi:hypothetical protein DFH07DRAFT_766974 [Mycena maculata]|uniref:Uncharacterized protein n=1 Tax=Mycena maculata TaxID=230809 RepID=A0AAD7NV35_9AGAR|nr:hypothetical protein DFH07DRAFT_766974 [Mycena maculata]